MTSAIIGILSGILAMEIAALLLVLVARVRNEGGRLDNLEKWSARFSNAMRELLDVPNIPEDILDDMHFLNSVVADKRAPRVISAAFFLRGIKPKGRSRPMTKDQEEGVRFLNNNEKAASLYMDLTVSAFLTVSYRSIFWGPRIRDQLAGMFADRRLVVVRDFARAVEERVEPRLHDMDCAAAA